MEKGMSEITDIVFSETNEVRDDETEEEKNSGGLMKSLISNLVAPLSPKVRDTDPSTSPQEDNGGIFNSLVSSILHQTGGEDEREGAAASERGGGGDGVTAGGLVDSPLPTTPVADDGGLATDEASILIHSIVHD